jgi:putative DNA primase/helicase
MLGTAGFVVIGRGLHNSLGAIRGLDGREPNIGGVMSSEVADGNGQPLEQGSSEAAKTDEVAASRANIRLPFRYDDVGNGERFACEFEDRLRYVPRLKKWFVWWDRKVWSEDHPEWVERLAKDCARSILLDPNGGDADVAKKTAAWAKYSASVRGLKAMVETASSEEALVAEPSQFDSDPWLLNVQNGMIDLRTGELIPHDPDKFITRLLPVEYDPNATFDRWDTFLMEKVPDKDLRDYLQRAAGYTLTGDVSEEKMFFLYGDTASGKSTLLEAIQAVLGPYATTSRFKMFLENRNEGEFPPDLWRHVGSRMVVAQEVRDNLKFDKSAIKTMVSGNPMVAKRLYCDPFEFVPRWKIWVAANTQPQVDSDDGAMWRRIKVLPFSQSIPEDQQNPKLRKLLATDPRALRAILAWMVQGSLKWQKRGLSEPPIVRRTTQEYREANDAHNEAFNEFFDSHYELDPEEFVTGASIRSAYDAHWRSSFTGVPMTPAVLNQRLRARGLTEAQFGNNRDRGWRGMRPRKQ